RNRGRRVDRHVDGNDAVDRLLHPVRHDEWCLAAGDVVFVGDDEQDVGGQDVGQAERVSTFLVGGRFAKQLNFGSPRRQTESFEPEVVRGDLAQGAALRIGVRGERQGLLQANRDLTRQLYR